MVASARDGSPSLRAQLGRQRVRQAPHRRADRPQEAAQEPRRDLLARRVHGHDALGVHRLGVFLVEDLVALDHQGRAPALVPEHAADAQLHVLGEHLGEVALVEPDGLDGAGVVAQHGLDDVDPSPCRALGGDPHHGGADRRLLTHLEVADLLAVAEVLVAAREVVDEIAHGHEAERRELARDRRRHPFELGERARESLGLEEEPRHRRPLGVPAAAEAERESRPGHSAIMAKADVPGPMCVPTTAPT